MSREHWSDQQRASAFHRSSHDPRDRYFLTSDPVPGSHTTLAATTYTQSIYLDDESLPRHAPYQYEGSATYPHNHPNLVDLQPDLNPVQDTTSGYSIRNWNTGYGARPGSGASEGPYYQLATEATRLPTSLSSIPQQQVAVRHPLTPVTAGSSEADFQGTARLSEAGKVRRKSSTATRRCRPASCTPCRIKKLRCSRSNPCAACVNRGDPEGCLWEGDAVPLYTAGEDDEVTRLQAHVQHLEALIAALPPPKEQLPASTAGSRQPARRASAVDPPNQRLTTSSEDCYDMTAQDLGGALVSLITSGAVVPGRAGQDSFLPNGQSSRRLLRECGTLVAGTLRPDESEPFGPPRGAALRAAAAPSLEEMLALLPPEREMRIAYDFYRPRFASFYYSVNHDEIEARWPRMKAILDSRDSALFAAEFDPHFFALVLATCVAGLSRMPDSVLKQHGMRSDGSAEGTRWAKVAVLFLEVPTDSPTLSTIRAATILGLFFVSSASGTPVPRGMRMFSLGASAALELGLNRDPLEGTLRECEEHRRTFWALFVLSIYATSATGKSPPTFDLRYIDCAFPQEYHNDELDLDERAAIARLRARRASGEFEETWITNQVHHFKIAYLAKATYDEVFAARSCSYEVVLEQDKKFVEVEAAMPEAYQFKKFHDEPLSLTVQRAVILHACLSAEVMRLHRPFLSLAANDERFEYSRSRCIKYARRTLYLYNADWLMSFLPRALACICILIDLSSGRTEEREGDLERVQYAYAQLDAVRHTSPLHERGRQVLLYLLNRVQGGYL